MVDPTEKDAKHTKDQDTLNIPNIERKGQVKTNFMCGTKQANKRHRNRQKVFVVFLEKEYFIIYLLETSVILLCSCCLLVLSAL